MTTAVIALAAALAALALAGLVAALRRPSRQAAELRVTEALQAVGQRMDALSAELREALERVRDESRRVRVMAALGNSLDVDEVLSLTVEAAEALTGADASVLTGKGPDGTPFTSSVGVPPAAAERQAISGPPDGSPVRAVALSYHLPPGIEAGDAIRSAIAVPLRAGNAQLGFLAVYSRSEEAPVGAEEFRTLEEIAEHAGPAIENARRFEEARRHTDLDPLTTLPNRVSFHDSLAREVGRAHRHERPLALCVVDVDGFRQVNERAGQIAGDAVLSGLAERLREAARPGDMAFRIGGDEFAVLQPDAGRMDAESLFVRVQASLRRRPIEEASGLTLSSGITELRSDDDALSLFARAEGALGQAKAAGKGTAA